jgi:type IV secretory pathway VirD2 relaxase
MATSERAAPRFHPRLGGKRVPVQRLPTFRESLLLRLRRRFGSTSRAIGSLVDRSAARRPKTFDWREPPPDARRCVVKARVVPMNARGLAAAKLHLDYIEREGVEPDGTKGQMFGESSASGEGLRMPLPGEKHQFRIIVSPEDKDVDLEAFTRALMRQVQTDLGRDLVWGAVRHYDTDNPHVHIVIRGVDRLGRALRIDPEYISRGMRWRAQRIATDELGPRSEFEIDRQRDREVTQERLTTLDRDLDRRARGTREKLDVDLGALKGLPSKLRSRLIGRLQVLEDLNLARRRSAGTWTLQEGWQESLRALGARGDIIKRIHRALAGQGSSSRYRTFDAVLERPPVEGILRRKGLHDELKGEMYAVLEDAAGGAHYVRIDPKTAERVSEGEIVRASVAPDRWAKVMDAAIVAVAADNGGVYDPAAHLAAMAARPPVIAGRKVEPAEVVAANRRRLARLQRHNFVRAMEGGRWHVPPDLITQLKARDASQPRLRVSLETIEPSLQAQVERRAPTWLDKLDPTGAAPYGFGADLQRALSRRARFVAALELEPGIGTNLDRLTELERRDIGERVAAANGCRFVPVPPTGFQGVVLSVDAGRRLAILDHRSRQLTIVAAQGTPASLNGRLVEIVRGPGGALVLQQRALSKE